MAIPDPCKLWRDTLDRLEGEVNSLAERAMVSKEFSLAFNQIVKGSLGVRHLFGKSVAGVFRKLDMPSRSEVVALSEAVQRVEDTLCLLLPEAAVPSLEPRPKRTRRPLDIAPEEALAEAQARAGKKAGVRRRAATQPGAEV